MVACTKYLQGWKKKLSYCIAFSVDGATDVTRRYVRDADFASDRSRAPEASLLNILNEIKQMRRREMSKADKFRLEKEDAREEKELRMLVVVCILKKLEKSIPSAAGIAGDSLRAESKLERERNLASSQQSSEATAQHPARRQDDSAS